MHSISCQQHDLCICVSCLILDLLDNQDLLPLISCKQISNILGKVTNNRNKHTGFIHVRLNDHLRR